MRIALIGTRGVPANYGGFETCAEEIAVALAKQGHDVTAYCRYDNAKGNPAEFKGVTLVYRSCIPTKSLGTLTHTFNCILHAMRRPCDILMVFNAANSPQALLARLFTRKAIAINVDGLEWRRRKWGLVGRTYYQFAEWLSTKVAHRVVSDSLAIMDYYKKRWMTNSTFIPYGAHVEEHRNPDIIKHYGLEPDEYFFVASRLEPENNADITVKAFKQLKTDKKLVIAGGANWESPFIKSIQEEAKDDPRIRLLGPVYEPGHIPTLHTCCFAYVHGNEVGGTNPALLKAMGYGNCVLAFVDENSPFNAEVLAGAGLLYGREPDDLLAKMQRLLDEPGLVKELRDEARRRVSETYTWQGVAEKYELLFKRLASNYYRQHCECD